MIITWKTINLYYINIIDNKNNNIQDKTNFYLENIKIINNINNISNNIENNNTIFNNSLKKNIFTRAYEMDKILNTNVELYNNYYSTLNILYEQERKLGYIIDKLFDEKTSNKIRNDFKNMYSKLLDLQKDINLQNEKIYNYEDEDFSLKILSIVLQSITNAFGVLVFIIIGQELLLLFVTIINRY